MIPGFSFEPAKFRQRLQKATDGQSASALARTLGFHVNTVRNYLEGNRLPSCEFLATLAGKLRVNVQWLLTGQGPESFPSGAGEHAWSQVTMDIPDVPLLAEISRRLHAKTATGLTWLEEVEALDLPALASKLSKTPPQNPKLSKADEHKVAQIWRVRMLPDDLLWYFPDYNPERWDDLDRLFSRHKKLTRSKAFVEICYWHMQRMIKVHSTP